MPCLALPYLHTLIHIYIHTYTLSIQLTKWQSAVISKPGDVHTAASAETSILVVVVVVVVCTLAQQRTFAFAVSDWTLAPPAFLTRTLSPTFPDLR